MSGINTPLSENRSPLAGYVEYWTQSRLLVSGKNSLNELTPQEREQLLEKAENASSQISLFYIVTAIGTNAFAIFFFSTLFVLGGFAFIGKAIFTGSKLIFPISLAIAAGLALGIYFVLHSPFAEFQAELQRRVIEPLNRIPHLA